MSIVYFHFHEFVNAVQPLHAFASLFEAIEDILKLRGSVRSDSMVERVVFRVGKEN